MKLRIVFTLLLRLLAAFMMSQTLYFKFSGHEESVRLFTTLEMEPWGRISTGGFELLASIFILYPRTTSIGSAMGVGLMSGAIFFHFTSLGLKVAGNYLLFSYAVTAFVCCFILLVISRPYMFNVPNKTRFQ
ncbi:MAG TPA: DoxX family protein [Flavitalea sp.]|nr:DoxX family protein [Flavitalea sp.]